MLLRVLCLFLVSSKPAACTIKKNSSELHILAHAIKTWDIVRIQISIHTTILLDRTVPITFTESVNHFSSIFPASFSKEESELLSYLYNAWLDLWAADYTTVCEYWKDADIVDKEAAVDISGHLFVLLSNYYLDERSMWHNMHYIIATSSVLLYMDIF